MRVFSQGGHTKHRREWNTRTVPGLGPTVLAVGADGGGCLDIFSLIYHFYFLSPGDGPI